jgi:hypothetical protein
VHSCCYCTEQFGVEVLEVSQFDSRPKYGLYIFLVLTGRKSSTYKGRFLPNFYLVSAYRLND